MCIIIIALSNFRKISKNKNVNYVKRCTICCNVEKHWNNENMATSDKNTREKQHARLLSSDDPPTKYPTPPPSSFQATLPNAHPPSALLSPPQCLKTPTCKNGMLSSLFEYYSDGRGPLSGLSPSLKACSLWKSQILSWSLLLFLKCLSSFPLFSFHLGLKPSREFQAGRNALIGIPWLRGDTYVVYGAPHGVSGPGLIWMHYR
jgi:hypothetical protein